MVIDSHQHFWRIADRHGHWPPPALAPIHRDFAPSDLLPALTTCGVTGTVLVQSVATMAETDELLEIASRHGFVRGVVGWVDMLRIEAAQHIARLAQNPRLKGLRPMLQDEPTDAWAEDAAFDAAARSMFDHGLSFDALVLPQQLHPLLAFARRHPRLPIVIDHAAKPLIARDVIEPWRGDIESLAGLPNVHCKLSGLLTEAGPRAGVSGLAPYVGHLFEVFGPGRLMWGSDWPVIDLASDYATWFALAHDLCVSQPGVDTAALAAIFGGNAHSFYRLE